MREIICEDEKRKRERKNFQRRVKQKERKKERKKDAMNHFLGDRGTGKGKAWRENFVQKRKTPTKYYAEA